MSGFILTHRNVFDHPLFVGDAQRLGAWLWLVGKVCWKAKKFDIAGKIVRLERGQICVSRAQLAKAWGMSPSAVERFLTRLQTEHMIERATEQGRSILTIRNYDKYQAASDAPGQGPGQAGGQPPDSHRTTKEQGNKGTREPDGSHPQTPKHATMKGWPEIPEWVPVGPWNAFIEMRQAKRKVPTAYAVDKLIRKLERFQASGQDPGEVLDQSTEQGWTGIFELKDDKRGTGNRTGQFADDRRDELSRTIDRWANLSEPEGDDWQFDERTVRTGQGHSQGTLALPSPADG